MEVTVAKDLHKALLEGITVQSDNIILKYHFIIALTKMADIKQDPVLVAK